MTGRPFLQSAVLIAAVAVAALAGSGLSQHHSSFYSLVLPDDEAEAVLSYLEKENITRVFSSAQPVVYSGFSSLEIIPLADLTGRLLDSDRRFDPYLRDLLALYDTSRGSRIFFSSDRSFLSLMLLLNPLGDEVAWEQSPSLLLYLAAPVLYLLLGLYLVYRFRSYFFWPLAVLIFWIPYLFFTVRAHVVLLPLIIFWEINIIDNWGRFRKIFPEALAVIITGFLLGREGEPALMAGEILLSFATGLFVRLRFFPASAQAFTKKRRGFLRKKTEHSLFAPSYFGRPASDGASAVKRDDRDSLIPVLFLSLALALPFPAGGDPSFTFPGPGDVYDHLYYQENILYSLPWGSRDPVTVSSYGWSRDTGEIRETVQTVSRFSPSWLDDMKNLYREGFADSLILQLPAGTESLPIFLILDFNKHSIIAIMALFFLSKLILSVQWTVGKEKKSLQIIKRGREVA